MTERLDSVGNSEEGELSSVGSSVDIRLINSGLEEGESSSVRWSVETSSEDSEEEEADPRVKEEVGSRNDGISNCIEIYDYSHEYTHRAVIVWHLILFTNIQVH